MPAIGALLKKANVPTVCDGRGICGGRFGPQRCGIDPRFFERLSAKKNARSVAGIFDAIE